MDKWAAKLSQDALLVLTGLPRGSEFGFDGRLWVLDRFSVRPLSRSSSPSGTADSSAS